MILIDEYDKPVFASLIDSYSYQFNYEKYSRFQKTLKSFYQNLEELAEYLGYRFTEKESQIYNPFAAARVLDFGSFDNHWFNSGSPKLLFHLIQREDFEITKFEDLRVEKSKLNPASIINLFYILITVCFQHLFDFRSIAGKNISMS